MRQTSYGAEGEQILPEFRSVVKSYSELFQAQRDHIERLLQGSHRYSSGIFRESIIRDFLSRVLPNAVEVSSGFVYGFEQVENSRQIDILVWDALNHAPVYRTREFVILPPESVIAAISVKSALRKRDIEDSLRNLLSLAPLEIMYRSGADDETDEPKFRPITKIVLSYRPPKSKSSALATVRQLFQREFSTNKKLAREIVSSLREFDPKSPRPEQRHKVERIIPKLVASIDQENFSLIQGWGPPDDLFGQELYGPWELRRLPYMYPQENSLTTPLEKAVYYILGAVYLTLGTVGTSLVSAWGEFHPVLGARIGDASEVMEVEGVSLVDPEDLAMKYPSDQP